MASTFSCADILTDAARLANVPAFAADTNVTTTMATYWLVQGARTFTARLRQAFDDGDFLKLATLSVPAGLNICSLPVDTGEVHSAVWVKSSTDYRLLRVGNMEVLEDLADGDPLPWSQSGTPTYRIEGETIAFYPPSSEAESVILFYTDHLELTGETYFAARLDTDRWLALEVAIRVLQSQNRDASGLIQDKLMSEANIFSPARNRAPKRNNTIRDVRGATIGNARRDRRGR